VLNYDDLLLYWAQTVSDPRLAEDIGARFDLVLVDEYQDTNRLQASILLALKPDGRGLTVVGDDAQSIYSFRAATVRNILDFPNAFSPAADIITLDRNYFTGGHGFSQRGAMPRLPWSPPFPIPRGRPWHFMELLSRLPLCAPRAWFPEKFPNPIPRRLRLPACDGSLAVYACCKVLPEARRGAHVEEAIMWKRIAILGALVALTIWNPSHAVAQGWDGGDGGGGWGGGGCCGITVHVGFPNFCCDNHRFFPRRRVDCCDNRRFFPRRVDCCEERRFFPRQIDCCEERRFFPRRVDCCEERRFFPRRVDCCEDRRFFGSRFRRNWDTDYTDAGYGYDE
jgi:hypothetical protein